MRYRPHRGSLEESVRETKKYKTIKGMKEDISCEYYDEDDIVINDGIHYDKRIGYNTSMVCIKRCGNEKYKTPQCIGYIESK